MPRSVALLLLILALTGQPLRQAEAASDFARVLTHHFAASRTIEIPDGGVGDDSGVAVMKAETSQVATPPWCHCFEDLWPSAHRPSPSFVLTSSSLRRQERLRWFPTRVSQRHAWLQVFLL